MIKQEIAFMKSRADRTELRKFGRTIGIFLGLLAGLLFWYGSSSALWIAAAAALFLALGYLAPMLLKPIFIGWMSFAVVMGFFMTRVILTLLYTIVFAPVGLVIRLLGKDPLSQKIDPDAESYWIRREQTAYDPVSTEKQY